MGTWFVYEKAKPTCQRLQKSLFGGIGEPSDLSDIQA
jgi:hypothetical protein